MNFFYEDTYESAGAPIKLYPYIYSTRIWPEETIEKHAEIEKLFTERRNWYQKLDRISREDIELWKFQRLKNLIEYAYNNFDFYKKLYNSVKFDPKDFKKLEDLKMVPILKKEDLYEIYKEASNKKFIKIQHESRTSGSSGTPLSLINDVDAHRFWYVQRLQMFEHMLGEKLKKDDWIYNIYYEPFLLSSIFGNYRVFTVGIEANKEDIIEHIRKLKPKIITGVASHILDIAKQLPDAEELGIKLITTNSEPSSAALRRSLSKELRVPILDEYSSEEFNIIAWEDSKSGDYIVAEDNIHLELIKLNTNLKTVVGTDLWNYSMPKIRYSQNDYSEWKNSSPQRGLQRLTQIIGRKDMELFSPTYGYINPSHIMSIFDCTLIKKEALIKEFRLTQPSLNEIKLIIKRERESKQSDLLINNFKEKFMKLFGDVNSFQIEETEELPKMGIKNRCIVREFNV